MLITYLKQAETEPLLLNQEFEFTEEIKQKNSYTNNIKPSQVLVVGRKYTIDDLLKRMIVYSDNDVQELLQENMNKDIYNDIFTN